ncbi:MAG: type II toxin-antitoxin system Phd/YefM family antitoxin [Desulfobacteraceae bacterium]
MPQVGAYEAKTCLAQLLEQVARGKEIIITKHGVPVAVLVPVAGFRSPDPKAAVAAIKALRRGHRLAGLPLRQVIEEGRL